MSRPPRARPPGRRLPLTTCVGLAAVLLATGCGADDTAAAPDGSSTATPHGDIAGAEELPEPQLQLAYLDDAGAVHALDLLTEQTEVLGDTGTVGSVATDGRFVFAASDPDGRLTVIDAGTWTVDHGDHVHYYRAPARVVGTLAWSGEVRASSSETLTALFSPTTGAGVVLDRAALAKGQVEELGTVEGEPHDGALIPLGDRVVSTGVASVVARDAGGRALEDVEAPCVEPREGHATRVGVVVSCADGAVLATATDDGVVFERIPYPAPVAAQDRAAGLDNRPGRPAVAAPAGSRGVWLLDSRARTWQLLPTATPWVHAVAVDDDHDRVVGVDVAGRVVVLDPEAGTTAATEPVLPPDRLQDVDLHVDAARAYVNVPGGTELLEIDYADGARVARRLPALVSPDHLAETGR